MRAELTETRFKQMHALYEVREQVLLEGIAEKRIKLDIALEKLAEQQALVDSLREQLEALHNRRSNQHVNSMSVQSFHAETVRRELLTYDFEKEEFYLPGFVDDVRLARRALALEQRNWMRMRERIKALGDSMNQQRLHNKHKQVRAEEALLDDRRPVGEYGNG